jgi:hypothetical protein
MSSLPIAQKFLDACKEYRVKLDQLERENAALREDKEILDWMNGNIEAIMFKYKPDGFVWDVREIMRGAMSKKTKP